MWQDFVITICLIAFSYALIPQVYSGFKKQKSEIAFQTSLITSIGLFILSIMYISLELYLSTIIALITGGLWAILFFQKVFYK